MQYISRTWISSRLWERIHGLQKKKRKFQVNMPEEYRHKNPQQDIKKSNSTILEKHHDPLN